MVSAQIAGNMSIYIRNPAGQERLVKAASQFWWGPGGSSDATIANTPEKWNFLTPSADKGGPGYSIVVKVTAGAAATMDASDSAMLLPVIVNGNMQFVGNSANAAGLGNSNFTVDLVWADTALVAAVETPVYMIRAKEGVYFQVGGDRVFISNENNA